MSTKVNVPTFRIFSISYPDGVEGPVVAADKRKIANNLVEVHELLREMGALLIYDRQWLYLPFHAITSVIGGKQLFSLPWPLVTETDDQSASE